MWEISKEFEFCYAHRVWSQTLLSGFSDDSICKCRHLHGHNGTITVHLEGNKLKNGMVFDYKNLDFIKTFINDVLDHKCILDIDDPAIPYLCRLDLPKINLLTTKPSNSDKSSTNGMPPTGWLYKDDYWIINPDVYKLITNTALVETLESYVFVTFVPTSENMCKWLFDLIKKKIGDLVTVTGVDFYETSKTKATYTDAIEQTPCLPYDMTDSYKEYSNNISGESHETLQWAPAQVLPPVLSNYTYGPTSWYLVTGW